MTNTCPKLVHHSIRNLFQPSWLHISAVGFRSHHSTRPPWLSLIDQRPQGNPPPRGIHERLGRDGINLVMAPCSWSTKIQSPPKFSQGSPRGTLPPNRGTLNEVTRLIGLNKFSLNSLSAPDPLPASVARSQVVVFPGAFAFKHCAVLREHSSGLSCCKLQYWLTNTNG